MNISPTNSFPFSLDHTSHEFENKQSVKKIRAACDLCLVKHLKCNGESNHKEGKAHIKCSHCTRLNVECNFSKLLKRSRIAHDNRDDRKVEREKATVLLEINIKKRPHSPICNESPRQEAKVETPFREEIAPLPNERSSQEDLEREILNFSSQPFQLDFVFEETGHR